MQYSQYEATVLEVSSGLVIYWLKLVGKVKVTVTKRPVCNQSQTVRNRENRLLTGTTLLPSATPRRNGTRRTISLAAMKSAGEILLSNVLTRFTFSPQPIGRPKAAPFYWKTWWAFRVVECSLSFMCQQAGPCSLRETDKSRVGVCSDTCSSFIHRLSCCRTDHPFVDYSIGLRH